MLRKFAHWKRMTKESIVPQCPAKIVRESHGWQENCFHIRRSDNIKTQNNGGMAEKGVFSGGAT